MKCVRFLLIMCLVSLLSSTSLIAAEPQKRGVQIVPKSPPALDSVYGGSQAVVIAIESYPGLPPVKHAAKDAREIENRLASLGFKTITLADGKATRENIIKILGDELPRTLKNNDRLVVFFAGNTQTELRADGTLMGYLVPFDADAKNIFASSISMDQLREISGRLPANHVLYIIDSCLSGLDLTAAGSVPSSDRNYLRKITSRKAHQVLTAGGRGESIHLQENGIGAFAGYLLQGLDGAAEREGKGFVAFDELASYVKQQVSLSTANRQVPQYGNIEGEGEVVFALVKRPPSQPGPAAADRGPAKVLEIKDTAEADTLSLAEKQKQMEELKRRDLEKRKADAPLPQASRPKAAAETGRDGRFIAYDDGTVTDTRSGLMWATKDNGLDINWQDAKSYCENYRGGGYSDWRLPTQDELAGLYDEAITNVNPPSSGCTGNYRVAKVFHLTCCCAWASETRGGEAAYFGFGNGPRAWLDHLYAGGVRALPVRSAK